MPDDLLRHTQRVAACAAETPLFAAIEIALNSGIGRCYVTDANHKLVGELTLEQARKAILDGAYLAGPTAGQLAEPVSKTLAANAARTNFGALAAPVLDSEGRVVDVAIDHAAEFVPVAEPYLSHSEFRNLMDAFLSTWISSAGQYIRDFESRFSTRMGATHGIAVSNGTVSLHLAMVALGLKPGDEVIVPDLTFAASINTVIHAGATPVIIDVDRDTWVMDPDRLEAAITPRTRAVMPVHVFGRPCPMTEIMEVANRRGLYVIEDAAESHGATYDGRPVGSFGQTGSFSFFGNKNITTGEGGMVVTSEPELAERMRVLRDHGMKPERRYWHDEVGYNYRMTNLQASIGCAQLSRLQELLAHREHLASMYVDALSGIPGLEWAPAMGERYGPVTWFVSGLVPINKRAELIAACKDQKLDLRPFFHGLSVMPAYRPYGRPCPNSDYLSRAGVNFPTFGRVDENVIGKIASTFRKVLSE